MLLWFKALHLISMVAWFAGLFYMFRLFVYHAENKDKPEVALVLKTMAMRLFFYITTPAMFATLFFGLGMLAMNTAYLQMGWLHPKLLLVALLIGYHVFIGYVRARFSKGDVFLSSKACRLWNEFPTPILVAIIILAVLRPF